MNVVRMVEAARAAERLATVTTWWARRPPRTAAPSVPAPRIHRIDDDIYELACPDGDARW